MNFDIEKANKIAGAVGSLGSGTVLKALGKFLPGINSFVSGAYTAGYASDQILDFVKDKLESPAQRRNKEQLQSRADQGIARSDEQAALSQIEQNQSPLNALEGLGKLGAQAAGGFASARAGSKQQALENEQKQQQIDSQVKAQEDAQKKQEEESTRRNTQDAQAELSRKENLGFKQRAEERAIEEHLHKLNKSAVKGALNKRIPETHGDVLKELYDLANRFK